ncbi:hypothetical protein CLF_107873 [Clonorchis sinensis]|uniref:Uncharacterized protein n=1 Tax=Clonorchis sinensis TaxID=79923 RepID=G7YHA9_CLOSI|nr:hypothetical protein CLF_107873 [Clonorchis sinensis]
MGRAAYGYKATQPALNRFESARKTKWPSNESAASETSVVSQVSENVIMDGCLRQTGCLISQSLLKRLGESVNKHFNTISAASEGVELRSVQPEPAAVVGQGSLPGLEEVSRQHLLSDHFVEGMQPALLTQLRLSKSTGQLCGASGAATTCDGKRELCLIDTEAGASLRRRGNEAECKQCSQAMRAVGGYHLKTDGFSMHSMRLANRSVQHEFLISVDIEQIFSKAQNACDNTHLETEADSRVPPAETHRMHQDVRLTSVESPLARDEK